MRVPRTLSLYLLRETLQYAVIGFLAVGSVLLTQNLLRRLNDLTGFDLHLSDVASLTWCLLAMLAAYTIPVAFLFGVLVSVGRLSSDSEVKAMRALGVSLAQFVTPFLLLALGFCAVTGVLLYDVQPAARRELRAVLSDIASRGGIIEPGRFNRLDRQGQRLLYVDDRDEDNRLFGVLISDRTDENQPFTVVAEQGRFLFDDATTTAHLELEGGDIHFEPSELGDPRYQRIAFREFDYAFDMSGLIGAGFDRIRPSEMSTADIRAVLAYFDANGEPPPVVRIRTRQHYEIQLHRRLALPFAPLLFALVGVPLGLRRSSGARSSGVLLCVVLVFGYYALLSAGIYAAEERALPAAVAVWIPNGVFAVIATSLVLRARRAET